MKKTPRQPTGPTMKGTIAAARMNPAYQALWKRPVHFGRSFSGNASATPVPPMNHSAPSPNPATKRAAASSGMFCASPEASVPIAYRAIEMPSARRRPTRSASRPTRNELPHPARKIAKNVSP
ncbi:MAG TPA: hypothetical protein VG325_15805 [Solirubrobacteraceae bacterium]|nr:hypothetical protein [Solirubrobacteraceae bacterium]